MGIMQHAFQTRATNVLAARQSWRKAQVLVQRKVTLWIFTARLNTYLWSGLVQLSPTTIRNSQSSATHCDQASAPFSLSSLHSSSSPWFAAQWSAVYPNWPTDHKPPPKGEYRIQEYNICVYIYICTHNMFYDHIYIVMYVYIYMYSNNNCNSQ